MINYPFTIRNLKILQAVAEYGNFTEAAQNLYVSQPAISSQIRELERLLQMKLIERNVPIIIEKPLTTSVQESNNLLKLAEQKSSIVLVDHIFLYHPIFILLKEYIKSLENKDLSLKMLLIRSYNLFFMSFSSNKYP